MQKLIIAIMVWTVPLGVAFIASGEGLLADAFYENKSLPRFDKEHFSERDFNWDKETTIGDAPAFLLYTLTAPFDAVVWLFDANERESESYAGFLSVLISTLFYSAIAFALWMIFLARKMHESPNKQN